MKNLKKLVSVIVTVAMLISSFAALGVSAAEYGDVDATNGYYKAIKVLSGLGVVKGDEEGNFNPTSDIKRSEMVTLVCRALGEEAVALSSGGASFDDVAADHWAAGYIKWAVDGDIVQGVGDNKFAPDASVKFQDAVVMVLRALGYERIAQRAENGGYPTGYLKVASQKGVTANTNNFAGATVATREVVAQVIYNALTTPLVDVSYYAPNPEDDEYVVFDGKNNTELRTLLTYTNEIYKVKATVEETAKTNADLRKDVDNQKVELEVIATYDYDYEDVLDGDKPDYTIKPYVGDTDVAEYLGYTVEAYIAENDDEEWELLAVAVDSKSTVSETVSAGFEKYDAKAGVFEYYADEDDSRTTEIDVDDPEIYYNGSKVTTEEINKLTSNKGVEHLLVKMANSITFMGPKNADYTKIFVTDYTYAQVDSVKAEEEYVKFSSGLGVLSLNAEDRDDESFIYNLYDADGNAITLADVQEDDLFNIVAPATKGDVDLNKAPYMDIYVTSNTVTGTVTEEVKKGLKYNIDGVTYEVVEGVDIEAGDAGIFYITIDGLVYDADADSAANKNYAFIVNYDYDDPFSVKTYTLRLFTSEGTLANYKVASTLRVYKTFANEYGYKTYKRSDKTQDKFFGIDEKESIDDNIKALVADVDETTANENLAKRVVTYKLNSDGEISELRFAGKSGDGFYEKDLKKAARYNDDLQTFAGEDLDANSMLFVAPLEEIADDKYNVDEEDLKLAAFSSLNEEEEEGYPSAHIFMFDNEDYLSLAILGKAIDSDLAKSHLAVVKAVTTSLDAEDTQVIKYTFVQSGEILTKVVDAEADAQDIDVDTKLDINEDGIHEMSVGDVFRYAVNAEGEIDKIDLIYAVEKDDFDAGAYPIEKLEKEEIALVSGVVVAIDGNKLTIDEDGVWDEEANTGMDDQTTLRMNETEGNTYAQVDVARLSSQSPSNAVKALSGYSYIKESYGDNVYKVVAIVNEDERFEDIVQIYTEK